MNLLVNSTISFFSQLTCLHVTYLQTWDINTLLHVAKLPYSDDPLGKLSFLCLTPVLIAIFPLAYSYLPSRYKLLWYYAYVDTRLSLWLHFKANTWWTWRTNECSSFEVRHLGYQLRRALRARKMSNGAINPPLVVIHALISKLRLEIYDFILCYVNRSLLTR